LEICLSSLSGFLYGEMVFFPLLLDRDQFVSARPHLLGDVSHHAGGSGTTLDDLTVLHFSGDQLKLDDGVLASYLSCSHKNYHKLSSENAEPHFAFG
jgi:hypothetical protein